MREYTKDEMKVWVKTAAPKRIGNALVEMFNRQTTDEQSSGVTCHDNGIGFNGVDAPILTSIAKWYMDKGFISPKQTALVRKKLVKYAGQLAAIATEKAKGTPEPSVAPVATSDPEQLILSRELLGNGITAPVRN